MKEFTIIQNMTVYSDWVNNAPDKVSITFSKGLVDRILHLSGNVKSLKVESINLYDYTPEFLDDEGKECEFSSESEMLYVRDTDFYWSGIVGGSDPSIHWDTDIISIKALKEMSQVWRARKSRLPLLMGTLKTPLGQQALTERMREL